MTVEISGAKNPVLDQLKGQNFISVPFSIDRETIEEAVDSFFRFLELPEEIKSHIDFSIAPQHRRGDVGYKHRNPEDCIYNDSKDFFHFHPALFDRYHNFLRDHPVVKDFVQKANPIWCAATEAVKTVLGGLETEFPGLCDKVFKTDNPHFLLRFLRYSWQESGELLAKPHYDAGSFTLAIAESHSGLRIGSGPEDLKPVEHQDNKAIFMLASNFEKLMDTQDLKAAWHDVIQLDKNQIGRPYARWAVVAFMDGHGVTALPRTETHKWWVPNAA